ncbi:hypothetical protein NDU88_006557 [Pleurodeles waltl]|uniref:Uncharacterized protein n=1 Tax=Pleurodeles waltl TaxID=8319 RepID=A0AAV7X1W6_PLEWA|nr:hypothetical protein NDU88_006557 [Pleurodeles waltl]
MREITQLENKLGPLETKSLSDTKTVEELQEAFIAHANYLERLCMIDYKAYTQKPIKADKSERMLARPVITPQEVEELSAALSLPPCNGPDLWADATHGADTSQSPIDTNDEDDKQAPGYLDHPTPQRCVLCSRFLQGFDTNSGSGEVACGAGVSRAFFSPLYSSRASDLRAHVSDSCEVLFTAGRALERFKGAPSHKGEKETQVGLMYKEREGGEGVASAEYKMSSPTPGVRQPGPASCSTLTAVDTVSGVL